MEPYNDNSTLLTRYLLGELADDQESAVEQRFFGDADFLEELQATECELIDCYVRGELSSERNQRFEAHFLSSPSRRKRVEFAYALSGNRPREVSGDAGSSATFLPRAPIGAAAKPQETSISWRRMLAAAASIIVVSIIGLWLLKDRSHKAAQPQIADQTQAPPETPGITKIPSAPGEGVSPQPPVAPPTPTGPTIATFFLTQMARPRSLATEQTLKIEPGVTEVRLNARLDSDDQERYAVILKSDPNQKILARPRATSYKSPEGPALAIHLKASALRTGKYELDILDSNGQPVAAYYFRIDKQQ